VLPTRGDPPQRRDREAVLDYDKVRDGDQKLDDDQIDSLLADDIDGFFRASPRPL
jgi:hypothetical protein